MSNLIAIIYDEIHPLLTKVLERLSEIGHRSELIHWSDLGESIGDEEHPLLRFDCIYLDRMGESTPSYSTQLMLLEILTVRFPNVKIVNTPSTYVVARNKALTAPKLNFNGIPTPLTLIAHKTEQVSSLLTRYPGHTFVAKSILGCCAKDILVFPSNCVPIEVEHLLARDGTIVVQKFVNNPERFIWRVDIVNQEIIVCNQRFSYDEKSIHPICNGTVGGKVIFWEPGNLPKEVGTLALNAVKALGLVIAGVDILVAENGELFVAEVNPEPDITLDKYEFPHAIADYLGSL